MRKEKKIVLVIVEGITDKVALEGVVSQLLDDRDVRFEMTNGDVTSDAETTVQNIKEKLVAVIRSYLSQSHLKASDIVHVVHLIDTDGSFVADEKVIYCSDKRLRYTSEEIETWDVPGILDRNRRKTTIVSKLSSMPQILGRNYSLFYFSRNMEHVFHDEGSELSNNEKYALAEAFEEKYINAPKEFLAYISDSDFTVKRGYHDSWDFIKSDCNSLKRYSNFHLLFAG
jgi:predicted XRE-type DNA-binding protein